MRAVLPWLALVPFLAGFGCRTVPPPALPESRGYALSGADAALSDALAHYSQALISENTLGEYQDAVRHFRDAARIDPSCIPVNLKAAADYISRKDYTGAVTVLSRALDRAPDSVEILLLWGSVSQALGRSADAERAFRRVIRLAPARPEGYIRLATLYVVRLAPRKALAVVGEGISRVANPEPILDFCETVGRVYLAGKDSEGAIRFFEPVFRNSKGHDETCELLAQCYSLVRRADDAAAVYEALRARHPGDARYTLLLGECREEAGHTGAAMEAYRLAVTQEPVDPMAVLRLANLVALEDTAESIRLLEKAVVKFPGDLRLHIFLAITLMRSGRYEESLPQFEWIATAMARNEAVARTVQPLFYFWYGQACERAGRMAESERQIEKYLALNPGSDEALNYLAFMWAEQGRNLEKAMAYVMRALEKEPGNGSYLDTLGWILYKQGHYDLALLKLQQAGKREPGEPVILEHLGDAYLAAGRRDRAVDVWLKSLRLTPGNTGLRDKLIRAKVDPGRLPAGRGK